MKGIVFVIFSLFANIGSFSQCWQSLAKGGYNHYLAIKTDGTLWSWGSNFYGQLGDGTTNDRNTPVQIGTDTDWKDVAIGMSHCLALKNDGSLWTWGSNGAGQLGDGTLNGKSAPIQMGTLNSWKLIAANGYQCFAIKMDGTLWAWGSNNMGQLGNGTYLSKNTPLQIGSDADWATVGAGYYHTLAVKNNGTLWAWGDNSIGQLGDGTVVGKNVPMQIGLAKTWKKVSCGSGHSLAIKTDGTLWAWGQNTDGQLGDGTNVHKFSPVQVGSSNLWRSVSAGFNHSLATNLALDIFTWGRNFYGELGDSMLTFNRNYPAKLSNSLNWNDISGNCESSAGIKFDGSLFTWGYNNIGQLGDSTNLNKNFPTLRACPTTIVGIRELKEENLVFMVFPNPADDYLVLSQVGEARIEKIVIIDALGRTVLQLNGISKQISIKDLRTGVYQVVVSSEGRTYCRKFIKQ